MGYPDSVVVFRVGSGWDMEKWDTGWSLQETEERPDPPPDLILGNGDWAKYGVQKPRGVDISPAEELPEW